MYALGVQIHGQSHQIHITGALTITKQTTLYPCRTRQLCQLRRRHARTPVIVRVHTDGGMWVDLQDIYHGFNLIGIHIWRIHFHRGRQIQYQGKFNARLPFRHHRLANLSAEIQFRHAKCFRRIFQRPMCFGMLQTPCLDLPYRRHSQVPHLLSRHLKYLFTKHRRGGIVYMHNGLLGPKQRCHSARYQFRPRLRNHLYAHIIGNVIAFNQITHKIKIRLRGRRKCHLNFFKTNLHQILKILSLTRPIHRIGQRLIAIAQIGGTPTRRLREYLIGPAPLRSLHDRKGCIFVFRMGLHHGSVLYLSDVISVNKARCHCCCHTDTHTGRTDKSGL